MPSINLAPGTQQVAAAQKRRRRLYVLTTVILLATAGVWGGVLAYQQQLNNQADEVQQQLRNVQTETARLSDQASRVRVFESRLEALGGLLDNHKEWEPILQSIESLVPTSVVFTRFDANSREGELLLSGTTTDIDQVALALASFLERKENQSVFSSGVLSGIDRKEAVSPDEGVPPTVSYDFRIELTFQPSILTATQ